MTNSNNLAIFISSCDKYSDLWQPFFHFFSKYWSDCPFQIFLSTNNKDYFGNNVVTLKSEQNSNWSSETLTNLQKVNFEYILYLQDDYLFLNKVETSKIQQLLKKMIQHKCDYLRLFPSPGGNTTFSLDKTLEIISENAAYRTSLQAAIWKKSTFENIIKSGETPWEFEINSPARSKDFLFLSVIVNKDKGIKYQTFPITYYYLTAVFKGKWVYGMRKILKEEGITIDKKGRKVESYLEKSYREIYNSSPLFIKKILDYISKTKTD